MGFVTSKAYVSLFVYRKENALASNLLYVDDIILTASTTELLQQIINALETEFPMLDLGKIHHFLVIKADYNDRGMFLSQTSYAKEIIQRENMTEFKPIATPVEVKSELSTETEECVKNPTEYRSLARALQYLTFTRPGVSYDVHPIFLYMHDPRLPHLHALKQIIRYVKGMITHGMQLHKGSIDSLTTYSDADWGGGAFQILVAQHPTTVTSLAQI